MKLLNLTNVFSFIIVFNFLIIDGKAWTKFPEKLFLNLFPLEHSWPNVVRHTITRGVRHLVPFSFLFPQRQTTCFGFRRKTDFGEERNGPFFSFPQTKQTTDKNSVFFRSKFNQKNFFFSLYQRMGKFFLTKFAIFHI